MVHKDAKQTDLNEAAKELKEVISKGLDILEKSNGEGSVDELRKTLAKVDDVRTLYYMHKIFVQALEEKEKEVNDAPGGKDGQ